ncbi:MAG: phosphoadenylyl-sulfate reductase [Rhodospirillales bacterium]
MPLLDATGLVPDDWTVLDATAPLPGAATPASHIIVPLDRWLAERESLTQTNRRLGLALPGGADLDALAGDLDRFDVISISFPAFSDGRGYSTARLLRERHGFEGELRATGDVLRDQIPLMARCGFDTFEVADNHAKADWVKGFFSRSYQPAADRRTPVPALRRDRVRSRLEDKAEELNARYGELDAEDVLQAVIGREFPGRIALVSSFGAESVVLLHLVSRVEPSLPILFIDTGKLFGETKRYRDQLIAELGLTGLTVIGPDTAEERAEDPDGILWTKSTDACCDLRKVRPLARALGGYDAWISGRKVFHGGDRSGLGVFDTDGQHVKVNPLAHWSPEKIKAYMDLHDLPTHPLVFDGYLSIGCMPCTDRAVDGDPRSGRWKGQAKTECGIHRNSSLHAAE